VIRSFRDSLTEDLYHGARNSKVRKLPPDVVDRAVRKLDVLNAANALGDLRSPPGNRLESLHGDLLGFHSIRVNDQWRIVFRWDDGAPHDVQFTDYHRG
jgi:proteic killer suppression protein